MLAKFSMNSAYYCTSPQKDLTCDTVVGFTAFPIAELLLPSYTFVLHFFSSSLTTCPRYCTSLSNNLHFSGFTINPTFLNICNTASQFLIFSWVLSPVMHMLFAKTTTPFSPCRTCTIVIWKRAAAGDTPKSILLGLKRPKRVVSVIASFESSESINSVYTLLRSNLVNNLSLDNRSKISFMRGKW